MPYAWRGANTQLVLSAPVAAGPQAPEQGVAAAGLAGRGAGRKIVAQGGRCAVGLGGRLSAVRAVAQTGRGGIGVTAAVVVDALAVSGSFTHVTLTRDYDLATGEAPTGVVYCTLSQWLLNNAVTVVPAEVGAALDSAGQISIALVANNDPGTTPPSHYTVREAIIGQPERRYNVQVPYNAGTTIDLSTLPVIP